MLSWVERLRVRTAGRPTGSLQAAGGAPPRAWPHPWCRPGRSLRLRPGWSHSCHRTDVLGKWTISSRATHSNRHVHPLIFTSISIILLKTGFHLSYAIPHFNLDIMKRLACQEKKNKWGQENYKLIKKDDILNSHDWNAILAAVFHQNDGWPW